MTFLSWYKRVIATWSSRAKSRTLEPQAGAWILVTMFKQHPLNCTILLLAPQRAEIITMQTLGTKILCSLILRTEASQLKFPSRLWGPLWSWKARMLKWMMRHTNKICKKCTPKTSSSFWTGLQRQTSATISTWWRFRSTPSSCRSKKRKKSPSWLKW